MMTHPNVAMAMFTLSFFATLIAVAFGHAAPAAFAGWWLGISTALIVLAASKRGYRP